MGEELSEDGFRESGIGLNSMKELLAARGERQSSGAVRIMLPAGIPLDAFYLEGTGDVYVECQLATVSPTAPESLFRDLLEMNFFWGGTKGFTLALRKDVIMLEGRENERCLAEGSALDAWLGRAVDAVSAVLSVLTMPRAAEVAGGDETKGGDNGDDA